MRKWQCSFSVEGLNVERFIRYAAEKNIPLKGLNRRGSRKLTATAPEDAFPLLEQAAAQGGWQFSRGERQGAGHVFDAVRRRWLLVAVCLFCAGLLFLATRCMWQIEVIDAGVYSADIRNVLAEMDIAPPMLRRNVDPDRIRAILEWRYPRVAWVDCGWRGTTLVIRIAEGNLPDEEIAASTSADVVACRGGVIESIVTVAGTPVVAPGDVVQKGQVLIKGDERTSNSELRAVVAEGCVMARVWDAAQVKTPLYGFTTEYTGRTQQTQTIICPWFPLWDTEKSAFDCQDVSIATIPLGGFFIPLQVRRETRYEARLSEEMLDLQTLIDEGNAAATRKLLQSANPEESYVDIWVNWSIIDDEILLSEAIGERLMDIAQQESYSGMAATE